MLCQEHCFLPGTHRPQGLSFCVWNVFCRFSAHVQVRMAGWEVARGGTIYCCLPGNAGDLCALVKVEPFFLCHDNSPTGLYLKTSHAVIISVGLVGSDCKILGYTSISLRLVQYVAYLLLSPCLPHLSWQRGVCQVAVHADGGAGAGLLAGLLCPFCTLPTCCFLHQIIALVFGRHGIHCDVSVIQEELFL